MAVGLGHTPVYDYVLFYAYWLVTLYIPYFIIKTAYPPSLQWDWVIWIAIMAAAIFVIITCTLYGLSWIGWNMMAPCGPGIKC